MNRKKILEIIDKKNWVYRDKNRNIKINKSIDILKKMIKEKHETN